MQQQLSATARVRAVGGGAEGGVDPDHVLYLQAAAIELHSALSAQRHVTLNMGVKGTTLRELKGLLDKHPVAHLLDPKRRRAEEGEGRQGSKRSRKRAGTARQHGFSAPSRKLARQLLIWRAPTGELARAN